MTVLREHFHPRPSVTVARFRFFTCSRHVNEPVQGYIARLRQLSRDCQFGSFLDEMIRDRLVCGIKSELIQSRLLSEPELSLQKATEMAVALETAGRNQLELAGAAGPGEQSSESTVQRIQTSAESQQSRDSRRTSKHYKPSDLKAQKCWRCLSNKHQEAECYFKRERCFRCSKYGHTSAAHKAGTVNSLGDVPDVADDSCDEQEPGLENDAVVGDLFACSDAGVSRSRPPILLDMMLNGQHVQMELDTGASVSVCSYSRFKELWPSGDRLLHPSKLLLRTFSGEKLVVRGEVMMDVGYQGSSYRLPLVVLEGTGPLLFGRN